MAEFQTIDPSAARLDTCAPYIHLLRDFAQYAQAGVNPRQTAEGEFLVFGTGDKDENGMRTLGNFIFTSALLAAEAEAFKADRPGHDAARMLQWARSALAYMTRCHVSGTMECLGGGQWGHEWQSAWWGAKMATGAWLIWDQLDSGERAATIRVVISEADRFIGVPARTGLFWDTKAEENAWDTEILAAALSMLPEHPHCPLWRAALIDNCLNSLSAPQDRQRDDIVDGKRLREQIYTCNVHSDYTIENHGPYHFCYVASPLLSLTWGCYLLDSAHAGTPEAQLFNVPETWQSIRGTFLDGRFAYMGGQDWARYTYGMYFIQPVLALLGCKSQDRVARSIELIRLDRLRQEQELNGDGSFYGRRVTRGRMFGQWAKYETDCFACIGMAYLIHKHYGNTCAALEEDELANELTTRRSSPESGLCWSRMPELFASFSWAALQGPYPIALFVPKGMDDATEWAPGNILGTVDAAIDSGHTLSQRRMRATGNGLRVEGRIMYRGAGTGGGWLYDHDLMLELLEDDGVMIVESRFTARADMRIHGAYGLHLRVANDLFNDNQRTIYTSEGSVDVPFIESAAGCGKWAKLARKWGKVRRRLGYPAVQPREDLAADWINIDNRLGIVNDTRGLRFTLARSHTREAPWQSLHFDTIDLGVIGRSRYSQMQTILHARCILVQGDAGRTAQVARSLERCHPLRLRDHREIS